MIVWLSNIKLTLAQWAGACAAGAIGLLVISLRLQGSRLHKAQTELLASQFGRTMDKQDQSVETARKRYHDALQEYEESK